MPTNRICVLLPFFGNWPDYLPLYLESCKGNPSIDFLFLTDLAVPLEHPSNVHFRPLSLAGFRALAAAKLGFEVQCAQAYKVCDFRPAFGVIFEDYLKAHDFWAHGDIDLVYGDLRGFLTADVLSNYDVVSVRREWISGPLTLFRNTPAVNELFQDEAEHVAIMQADDYRNFDECGLQWGLYLQTPEMLDDPRVLPAMTPIVRRAHRQGRIRAHFKTLIKEQMNFRDNIRVESGRVYAGRDEVLFYHFIFDKRRRAFEFPGWQDVPSCYYIRPTGLFRHGEHRGLQYAAESLQRRWRAHGLRRVA